MIRVSIIIPAYNVEEYLDRCIESINNQNVNKNSIEVIIINDGSTDNTLSVALSLQLKYSYVRVTTQKNCGLSATRNYGLKEAVGNYVWFIDSDDWIEENSMASILDTCEMYDLDILSVGRTKVKPQGNIVRTPMTNYVNKVISGVTCLLEDKFELPAQLYIFKREFLVRNSLEFLVGFLHEDKEFIPRTIFLSKRFLYSNYLVYYHFERVGSITNIVNSKRSYDLIRISNMTVDFADKNNLSKPLKKVFYRHAFFSLTLSALLAYKLQSKKEGLLIFKYLKSQTGILSFIVANENYIYKAQAIIFLMSPMFFSKIYYFLKKDN